MRHSAARRSLLSAIGGRVRLADQIRDRARHTGPLAPSPARGQHRILRLVMVVGLAGAGLCLVLALTGLVVAIGASRAPRAEPKEGTSSGRPDALRLRASADYRPDHTDHPDHPDHTDNGRAGSPPDAAARRAGRFAVGTTIDKFRGAGLARHHKFKVSGPGDWGLSWTFTCPAKNSGRFTLSESDGKVTDDIELTASSPNGHGISWRLHDPGEHSLSIISDCSWIVRVVLPKP
jgi:hypothetical protein